jgi:hypothetical protein
MNKSILAAALIALASAAVPATAGTLVTTDGKPVVDSQGTPIRTNDHPGQCPECYNGGA